MANGLSSILGGLAQGFADFGKSAADMFGGAATNNALTVGLDALINKKSFGQASADARQRELDYRKWLYDTNSDKDAAAKGLGTALNGAQTALDLIPGLGQSAPVNALQGALGGLSDEFKFNGENYDLGNAGKRAALGAGVGMATGGLGKALANSGSRVLSNGVLRGATTGALGGALSQAGNTAIEGGSADEILRSAAQGAQGGALLGAGTGAVQSLQGALAKSRAKNNAPAIMEEETVYSNMELPEEPRVMAELAPDYQSRIAQAQAEIENIGPVSLFAKDADSQAKRARIMELNDSIKAWQNGYKNAGDYSAAQEAKRANRKPYEAPEAKYQPRIGETTLDAAPAQEGYTRLYRGLENDFDPKYLPSVDDNPFGYESWTDNYNLAKQYGNNVYSVDVPTNRIADQIVTADGERVPVVKTTKKAGLNGVDGVEYMLNANDPLRQELEYRRIIEAPDEEVMASRAVPGQLGLFDQTATKAPETGYSQLGLFDQPIQPKTVDAPVNGLISRSVEDLTQVPIDADTLPKGWLKARELADMGKRAKQIVLDPNAPNRAQNEYNAALYSDMQYNRNMPVADIIDKLGQMQYSKEIDRGAARILADQLDDAGDEFAKKFVTGAAEVGGNISHYKDAPKARLADQRVSELLNIGRSSSMLSDSLAKPTSRNALGDQWKGTINIKGNDLASGGDDASSVLWHERMHAFQDAENMGYDKRVVDAYNELREDLAKLQHDDKQILRDHGEDAKYWGKPIEQEARMAQHYLDSNYGVKNPGKIYARDNNGKIVRVDDNGQELDPNKLSYYTGKPVSAKEYAAEDKQIKDAFDKFIGKLQKLSKKGVALPAILAALGLGGYATQNQEEDENNNGQQI